MVKLFESTDTVIEKSIFAVWKEPHRAQRRLWWGNRSKLHLCEAASSFDLLTVDTIASVFLDCGTGLCTAGGDISQYYNRFRTLAELVPLLGFTKIEAGAVNVPSSKFVKPCLTCDVMGGTISVAFAPAVTSAALRIENRSTNMIAHVDKCLTTTQVSVTLRTTIATLSLTTTRVIVEPAGTQRQGYVIIKTIIHVKYMTFV